MQAKANGDELFAIETYGGVISFNLEECWYSAGTSSTHSLQAVPIRSPAAQETSCTHAPDELHAYACRLSSYGCRYLDSQFCAPLHALRASMGAGVAEKMLQARAYYIVRVVRVAGVMTWRLLHPRSC